MRKHLGAACLPFVLFLLVVAAPAQAAMSQTGMEADCLRRLAPIVPRDVKPSGVSFSALGNYAVYYVVTYRFTGELKNGSRAAACTYRRDGQWARDDAAVYGVEGQGRGTRGR